MSKVPGNKAKQKVPAHAWKPGTSGNPSGLPAAVREVRLAVKDALDKAFTRPDGADGPCIKIACDYRWGKPVQQVELSGEVSSLSRSQLLEQLPEAMAVLKGQG